MVIFPEIGPPKNCRFPENLTFELSKLGQTLTEDKTHYQSRVPAESNPLIFPLSSTTISIVLTLLLGRVIKRSRPSEG